MTCTLLPIEAASGALITKDQMARATHMLMAILRMSCVGLTLGRDFKKSLAYVI